MKEEICFQLTQEDKKCPDDLHSAREIPTTDKQVTFLERGTIVGNRWRIVKQIDPKLRFYTIYIVEHEKNGYKAALKIEQKTVATPILKFELFVLLKMEKELKLQSYCKVFDRGIADTFNFIVVTLCGKNLKTLRKESEEGKLTLACGLSVGRQCLRSLEQLHKIGFIHRSVNPTDFAIGRSINGDVKELRTIYLLDFGFARQYLEADEKTHKPPRTKPWVYRGLARYASRNTFLRREMSRLDDLEMWFYMVVEMIKGSLPWVAYRNPKDILEYQKAVRTGLLMKQFLGGLPTETIDIMKEIDRLQYKEKPNYAMLYNLLDKSIKKTNKPDVFPYDWEEKELEEAGQKADAIKTITTPIPEKK